MLKTLQPPSVVPLLDDLRLSQLLTGHCREWWGRCRGETKGQQVICLGLFDKSYTVQTPNYSISLLSVSLSCSKPEEKLSWRVKFTPCRWRRGNGTPLMRMYVEPQSSLCSHKGKVCFPVVTYSAFTHITVQQRKHWRVGSPRSGLLTVWISSKPEALGNHTGWPELSETRIQRGRLQYTLEAGKFSNNDTTTYS